MPYRLDCCVCDVVEIPEMLVSLEAVQSEEAPRPLFHLLHSYEFDVVLLWKSLKSKQNWKDVCDNVAEREI